jgi:hypothetical protein
MWKPPRSVRGAGCGVVSLRDAGSFTRLAQPGRLVDVEGPRRNSPTTTSASSGWNEKPSAIGPTGSRDPDLDSEHRDTLEKILNHPASGNIEWRQVRSLLEAVGTVVQERNGKLEVTLGA